MSCQLNVDHVHLRNARISALAYYHNDCLHAGPHALPVWDMWINCNVELLHGLFLQCVQLLCVCPPVFWWSGGTPNAANQHCFCFGFGRSVELCPNTIRSSTCSACMVGMLVMLGVAWWQIFAGTNACHAVIWRQLANHFSHSSNVSATCSETIRNAPIIHHRRKQENERCGYASCVIWRFPSFAFKKTV